MKATFKLILMFGEFLLICMIVRGQTNSSSQKSSSDIAKAAFESARNYQAYLMAVQKWPPIGFDYGEHEIPRNFWTDAIKELKPVKVYEHLLNVVIVLSIRDGEEEGIYLSNIISSYMPGLGSTDGIEVVPREKESLINFRRKRPPRFEDYPVTTVFTGTLAFPKIGGLEDRDAEKIRNGVEKGWGVFHENEEKRGANFAGQFILIKWGCGSPCLGMAMVDAKSREVFYPPITENGGIGGCTGSFHLPDLTYPGAVSQNPELQFRLDSSLLIIKSNSTTRLPYTFYFLWQGNRSTLLRKVALQRTE